MLRTDASRYEGHTPGPWDIARENDRPVATTINGGGRKIGLVSIKAGESDFEWQANGNLMTDAPLLLSRLLKAEERCERLYEACRGIANHKFNSYHSISDKSYSAEYGTGVVDGHRACSEIARHALALCEDDALQSQAPQPAPYKWDGKTWPRWFACIDRSTVWEMRGEESGVLCGKNTGWIEAISSVSNLIEAGFPEFSSESAARAACGMGDEKKGFTS